MTTTEREGGRYRRPRRNRPGRNRLRRGRRRLIWLLLLPALVVGGVFWFRWQCWGVTVTHTEGSLRGLPGEFDGYKIVQLSDLHGHEYGEGNSDLLARVAGERPDLIVITGDLIDREGQLQMVPALAKGLAAIAPTYYVTGNHEWALGTARVKELKNLLAQCGVTALSNQYEILERDGAQIVLAGVDDPNGYADQTTPEELAARIGSQAPGLYTVLLAHRNDRFDQYAAAGYDFVLSGHGHGGIIRLPFVGGLMGTGRELFPKWTSGLYTLGDSALFVSRGLGNNTTPVQGFRIFNRPELAVITLRAV